MAVKIKASFSKDTREYDGLGAISDDLAKDPLKRRVVVAVVEVTNTEVDHLNGGVRTPKVRFASMEVMRDDDELTARKLLDAAYHERTGKTAPPPTLFDSEPPSEGDGWDEGAPQVDFVAPVRDQDEDGAAGGDEMAAKRGRKK